jgi:adenine-specific DNA-methyltransferase
MILNSIGALVTDTLHKVRFNEGVDGNAVTSAFLNTYTLALSETLGRSYGGGVLTFEPGEMRRMRIPMRGAEQLDIEKIDKLQREGRYEEILSYTDKILLYDNLNLTQQEVALLHSIWNKMRNRRLMRKQGS